MAIRTSGKGSDLTIIVVPLILLIAVGAGLAGDPGKLFSTAERALWTIVEGVGRWLSSLI